MQKSLKETYIYMILTINYDGMRVKNCQKSCISMVLPVLLYEYEGNGICLISTTNFDGIRG